MSKSKLTKHFRFVVLYEDEDSGIVTTYAVWAATASEATARTITFIKEKKHHIFDTPYYLIPRIAQDETDYIIN